MVRMRAPESVRLPLEKKMKKKYVIAYDQENNKYWRGRVHGNTLFISVASWSNLPQVSGNPDHIVEFKDFDNIRFDSVHNDWIGGW